MGAYNSTETKQTCTKHWARYCLLIAGAIVLAYMCVGEFLPPPLAKKNPDYYGYDEWQAQQIVLLMLLSIVLVLLGSTDGVGAFWFVPGVYGHSSVSDRLVVALNLIPLAIWMVAIPWDSCKAYPFDGAPAESAVDCDLVALLADAISLVSARLARFNLGISLLLCNRAKSSWLNRATKGWLGLPETIALHRATGWWCVIQGAIHAIAQLFFYAWTVGTYSIWFNFFPVSLPNAKMNRLGLINFFGIVVFVTSFFLMVPAWPCFRSKKYHLFQRLHLPAALLFGLCCAMHDLQMLAFAIPGIADWYLGERELQLTNQYSRLLPAKAKLLPMTSGPWVELRIDVTGTGQKLHDAPSFQSRGEWALVRIPALGKEIHPFSVAVSSACDRDVVTVLVTARAGDWSRELAALSTPGKGTDCEVNLIGPFPVGGGDWSIFDEPNLLLVAGGSGFNGFIPAFAEIANSLHRQVHLVWCVKTESDYRALAGHLPPKSSGVKVTVYITEVNDACVLDTLMADMNATAMDLSNDVPDDPCLLSRRAPLSARNHAQNFTPLSPIVSLVAVVCSLIVRYWGWDTIKESYLSVPDSLLPYTLAWRLFPIAIVLAVLVVITLLGCWFIHHTDMCFQLEQCLQPISATNTLLKAELESAPLYYVHDGSTLNAAHVHERLTVGRGGASAHKGTHDLQMGRPDLVKIIRRAVELRQQKSRLVVAACGPSTLVHSTRSAVDVIYREGHPVCFSGTDSRW
jgi:hypothetical protein